MPKNKKIAKLKQQKVRTCFSDLEMYLPKVLTQLTMDYVRHPKYSKVLSQFIENFRPVIYSPRYPIAPLKEYVEITAYRRRGLNWRPGNVLNVGNYDDGIYNFYDQTNTRVARLSRNY